MDRRKSQASLITACVAILGAIFSFVTYAGSVSAADSLPGSGIYFITNCSSGEALQPVGPTPGQNVLLYPFTKSGMQKWTVTRLLDPKTKEPTNRYTIQLAGETPDLVFQPHDIAERTAMIGSGKSIFVLEPSNGALLVKSVKRNGDALYIYPYPPMNTEAHFGPSDSSAKFQWKFEGAN
jgi:hypothetical protein